MKDGKNGSPDKPFYQNILDEKSKRLEKSKATAERRKERRDAKSGEAPGAGRGDSGRRSPDGKFASRPRGSDSDRSSRFSRDDRASAPRSGSPRSDRDGKFAARDGLRHAPDGSDRAPRRTFARFDAPESGTPVFAGLSAETRKLLEEFPAIVQSVMPLDSRKLHELPTDIRELSHELTDERSERRLGYMNEPPVLSAYIRYYMWWNLVRLTRLFSGLALNLDDGDAAVDLGSGPLTLPISLWMTRPELRAKKITWYCVDLSQNALSAGEELLLALAAKTGNEPWQIVRIKGELGVSLRRRVRLVASANMFNELFWDDPDPIEAQAKRHAKTLTSYAEDKAAVLLIEPGVPLAGRFVSLMRDAFMRLGFKPASPCPHENVCPLPGLRGGKWCHFVFDTSDAPKGLHKLSDDAGLSKDRAALSFVYALRSGIKTQTDAGANNDLGESATAWASDRDDSGDLAATNAETAAGIAAGKPASGSPVSDTMDADFAAASPEAASPAANSLAADTSVASYLERVSLLAGRFGVLPVRITSDPIRLPDYRTGRYGCSELGMVLVTGTGNSGKWLGEEEPGSGSASGSLLQLPRPAVKRPPRDEKTGAILIELDGGSRPSARTSGDREGRRDGGRSFGRDRDNDGRGEKREYRPRDNSGRSDDRREGGRGFGRDRDAPRSDRERRPRESGDRDFRPRAPRDNKPRRDGEE